MRVVTTQDNLVNLAREHTRYTTASSSTGLFQLAPTLLKIIILCEHYCRLEPTGGRHYSARDANAVL